MSNGYILGLDGKAYFNTGSFASPTWVEVENIKDLTLNLETAAHDITTRSGGGFRQRVPTLSDGSVEFKMVYDPADTDFVQVRNDYFAKSAREWAIMSGPITTAGSEGLRAPMGVFNFSRSENLEEAMMADVSLKVSRRVEGGSALTPAWYVVP